jgi:CO/xanthine dehydrogenase FAD-binding subunit
MMDDHRYHSIFGAVKKCIAVNIGDTAPALIAGKPINEANAEAADAAFVEDAKPLNATKYRAQIANTLVKRALWATV